MAKTGLVILLKTETVCEGGCGRADVLTKYRVVGDTLNITGGSTVSVTDTVTVGVAGDERVMFPVKVPVPSPTGLTDAVKAAGVVALIGEMASQLPEDDALAETGIVPPLTTLRV